MTKQEEIRKGMKEILEDGVYNDTPFGETVDALRRYLQRNGCMLKVDRELPYCPYDSLIFPTTIEEAGKFLTDKGLTDREKAAVSGTIARLGWESATKQHEEAGYLAVEPL